jgi:pimeloyl-ACP methyl ester carboxylesterase
MSQEPVLFLGNRELALGEAFCVVGPNQEVEAAAHVVAEGEACAHGCWLAIRQPERVRRVVLIRPGCPDNELTQHLGEIRAQTLVVFDATAPPDAGQVFQQRIPRAYRFFVYAPSRLARLITDFLQRGETFIVNTGETRSW